MMVTTKKKARSENPACIISSEIDINTEQSPFAEPILSPSVTEFLDKYSFLKPILEEAPDRIRQFFPDADIKHEILIDPEASDSQTLVIFVYTDLSPEKAFEQMELLEKEWWLKAYSRGKCKLCIDIVFL